MVHLPEMVVAVTAIGCLTSVAHRAIDRLFARRPRDQSGELRLAEERLRLQEQQLDELRRQNALLERQVEWHNRLLEVQSAPSAAGHLAGAGAGAGEARTRTSSTDRT